jgi:hypothetical protein
MRSRFKPSQPGEGGAAPAPKEPVSAGPGLLQRGLQRLGIGRGGAKPDRPPEAPAPVARQQNNCGVDMGEGQLCGQLARRYDKQRGIPVCDDHTVWWCPACRQNHTRSQVKQVERSDRAIFVCRETLVAVE